MSDGTYRGRWIDEVFRTAVVSAEVKVFLLFLAHYHMDVDGQVSERRETLAESLRCHPRKISAKFEAAIKAGLLRQTARGQKHRNSAYQAAINDPPQGASNRHPENPSQGAGSRHPERSQGAGDYHPENPAQGAHGRHPEKPQGASNRHPENPRIYKDRAPAHFNGGRSADHSDENGHSDGANVVALFEDETPSLRSREIATVDRFAEFWSAYPRKVGKPSGRKAWDKAIKRKADPDQIILAARRYATDPRRSAGDIKYTAHPATWLNDERYLDEPEAPPAPAVDSRQQAVNDKYARAMQRATDRETREVGTQ